MHSTGTGTGVLSQPQARTRTRDNGRIADHTHTGQKAQNPRDGLQLSSSSTHNYRKAGLEASADGGVARTRRRRRPSGTSGAQGAQFAIALAMTSSLAGTGAGPVPDRYRSR